MNTQRFRRRITRAHGEEPRLSGARFCTVSTARRPESGYKRVKQAMASQRRPQSVRRNRATRLVQAFSDVV